MLVELASTPVAAGLFFLYIKDKYEKEPWKMLFLGVLFGLYTAAVVYALGSFLEERFPHEETPFYTAFFSSAGVEEAVKFLFLFFLIWGNRNFNEPLDGIVYGVFVSLGFAFRARTWAVWCSDGILFCVGEIPQSEKIPAACFFQSLSCPCIV